LCCPAPLALWKLKSGEAERGSGIGLKLFGFIPDSVFTFIPDHCSESSRIGVRHHPGIAFTFLRNPHLTRRLGPPTSLNEIEAKRSHVHMLVILYSQFMWKSREIVRNRQLVAQFNEPMT
jgi:hypothetical protein